MEGHEETRNRFLGGAARPGQASSSGPFSPFPKGTDIGIVGVERSGQTQAEGQEKQGPQKRPHRRGPQQGTQPLNSAASSRKDASAERQAAGMLKRPAHGLRGPLVHGAGLQLPQDPRTVTLAHFRGSGSRLSLNILTPALIIPGTLRHLAFLSVP